MDTVTTTPPPARNKFWNKKRIMWTALGVVAVALVAFVLIQKYRAQKTVEEQADLEEQIFMRMDSLSNKDFTLEQKDADVIDNRMDSLSNKDFTLEQKDADAIADRMKSLSQ